MATGTIPQPDPVADIVGPLQPGEDVMGKDVLVLLDVKFAFHPDWIEHGAVAAHSAGVQLLLTVLECSCCTHDILGNGPVTAAVHKGIDSKAFLVAEDVDLTRVQLPPVEHPVAPLHLLLVLCCFRKLHLIKFLRPRSFLTQHSAVSLGTFIALASLEMLVCLLLSMVSATSLTKALVQMEHGPLVEEHLWKSPMAPWKHGVHSTPSNAEVVSNLHGHTASLNLCEHFFADL